MKVTIIICLVIFWLYRLRADKDTKYYSLVSNYKRFLPSIDKKTIYIQTLFILLIAVSLFHYNWIINLDSQLTTIFNLEQGKFVSFVVSLFFVLIIGLSLFLWSRFFYKNKYFKEIISGEYFDDDIPILIKNGITLFTALLIVIHFGHTSKYYNNYHGLYLNYDDEEFVDMSEYYDYVEEEYSFEAAESLDFYNNDLFSNKENKSRDLEQIEHLFSKHEFLFEETAIIQGYDVYSNNEGFWYYMKCLILAFLEIILRVFVLFGILSFSLNLIQVISSFILKLEKDNDEQKEYLYLTIAMTLFLLFLANVVLPWIIDCGKEIFSWF